MAEAVLDRAASGGAAPAKSGRLESIDLLRGIVMVVMAIDHARDFLSGVPFDPTDVSRTTPALFFTRWITHFCAPVFMLLAGTGARLSLARGKSRDELSRFLLTRGLFLAVAELTINRFGWLPNSQSLLPFFAATLWALGFSMVVLAALVWLPIPAIAAFGAALVLGHNLFDGVAPQAWGRAGWIWAFLHGGVWPASGPPVFVFAYALVPWAGVMALGYVLGDALRWDAPRRRRLLSVAGALAIVLFVALRATNLYGDPRPWSPQPTPIQTVLSFLDCTKYPPSLLFLCMTLGPALLALPLLEKARGALADVFLVFGRVPLFFYFAHIYLLHAMAIGAAALVGKPLPWTPIFVAAQQPLPQGYGFGLMAVYALWLLALVALWPVCNWYLELKRRNRHWALSYV